MSPVSPLEMANVTATILSDGVWCPPNPIQSVTDRNGKPVAVAQQPCEQVVNPGLAHTLAAGLSKDTTDGTSAAAAGRGGLAPARHRQDRHHQRERVRRVHRRRRRLRRGLDGLRRQLPPAGDLPRPARCTSGNCGHGAFGGTVAAPPYFAAFNQLLAGKPDVPVPGPDDAYQDEGDRLPIVPYVVGQAGPAGAQAVATAGYQAQLVPIASSLPKGQVIGESPQGNLATGAPVTIWTSNGR